MISRQGKVRLARYYASYTLKERAKLLKEVAPLILSRKPRLCNVVEYKDLRLVYKRYASLFFIAGVDSCDNELLVLETIHRFVETLDRHFGNVCELDLIFNFHKASYVLDEMVLGGEVCEPSMKAVLRAMQDGDEQEQREKEESKIL